MYTVMSEYTVDNFCKFNGPGRHKVELDIFEGEFSCPEQKFTPKYGAVPYNKKSPIKLIQTFGGKKSRRRPRKTKRKRTKRRTNKRL